MLMQFFRQYRVLLISLILVLIGLHFISSSIDDPKNAGFFGRLAFTIYEPIYKTINLPFKKAGMAMGNLTSIATLREENEKLAQQNKALLSKLTNVSELAQAAERYQQLLELKQNRPDLVGYARVIARPSTAEYRIVVIDKGEKDGIKEKMPIVTSKGLLGHVMQTAPYASKVMLITDAFSSVPAIVQRTRTNIIAKGQSTDALKLKYLQRNEEVAYGDVVVTSGLGGIFPKGLVIGSIAKVTKVEFGIYQDAEVAPEVDLHRIEEVAILSVPDQGITDLMPPEQE